MRGCDYSVTVDCARPMLPLLCKLVYILNGLESGRNAYAMERPCKVMPGGLGEGCGGVRDGVVMICSKNE